MCVKEKPQMPTDLNMFWYCENPQCPLIALRSDARTEKVRRRKKGAVEKMGGGWRRKRARRATFMRARAIFARRGGPSSQAVRNLDVS
jgi:hypothetical protein